MSENEVKAEKTPRLYRDVAVLKQSLKVFAPDYAPLGVYVGINPQTGKYKLYNSALGEIRNVSEFDTVEATRPLLEKMTALMIAHVATDKKPNLMLWEAATDARDSLKWEAEAQAAGLPVEQYRAQKETEREQKKAAQENAKANREKIAALNTETRKIRVSKQGKIEITLKADDVQKYLAWQAAQTDGKSPLAEFLTTGDLAETQAAPTVKTPAESAPTAKVPGKPGKPSK